MRIRTDGRDSFEIADINIKDLVRELAAKRVCPCCTTRALAGHAAGMAEQIMGSAGAIEMLEELISTLQNRNVPAPPLGPSGAEH